MTCRHRRSPACVRHCPAAADSTPPRSSLRVWRPRYSFSSLSGRLSIARLLPPVGSCRGSRPQNRRTARQSRLFLCSRRSTRHLLLQRHGHALRVAPRARRGPHPNSFNCRRKRSRHNRGSLDSYWETAATRSGRSHSRVVDRSADRVGPRVVSLARQVRLGALQLRPRAIAGRGQLNELRVVADRVLPIA